MIVKFLDLFINKKVLIEPSLAFKFRFLAALMLAFIVFDTVASILVYTSIFQDSFNLQLYGVVLISVIAIIKFSTDIRIASAVFIFFSLWLNLSVINISGGIYSYNIKWLALIILFAIIFNYDAKSKMHFVYIVIAIVSIIYFYFIESHAHRSDFETKMKFKKEDYLVESILYILVFSTIIFFYYLSHSRLLYEINKKNDILEKQYKLNVEKTNELKVIKEKLEESNRDLKSYAHATSHDLKEPLRTITSFTQLLKRELGETELSPNAEEYLNYIELGGSRMYHLVEDALTLSKVNHIKADSFQVLDLNNIIDDVLKDLSEQINQSKAKIKFKNLPDVLGNPIELKRLFQNLISNAIKFAKENVPPSINISYQLKNNNQIFAITDNGKGINPAHLKSIFEPYRRGDNSKEGTGFGLAICKKIVQLHKGTIWAEQNSTGTSIKFAIPVV